MLESISSLFNREDRSDNPSAKDPWFISALTDCVDGIWDWNLETGDLFISAKLRQTLGYEEEETKKYPASWWFDQIHPDDQPEILRMMDELKSSKSNFTFIEACRFRCKNGEYSWLENHARIQKDANNNVQRITSMVINSTPQKYLQNQLYSIITEQEREIKNKMKFLSTLSHEFRSPLSGILGMTTLLKETPLSNDQLHFTDNILNSTEMLLALVNDILDVTKLNSGKFELETIRLTPHQVLKRAADFIRPTLTKKNLTFNLSISEDTPEYVLGDPTRLHQILVNLLSNAVKFTSKGSISLSVKRLEPPQLRESGTNSTILYFEIKDTGIGIAPEVQEILFEDYIQANRTITRMYGGTGLGLAICKELVQLMSGQIGVKSQPDQGSTFWFTIPFGEIIETPFLKHQNLLSSQKMPRGPKLQILLVEDNEVNQEVLRGLLRVLGDDVTVANNGEEAVEMFKTKEFDVILMDLNMPILDGLGATQSIRKLPHGDIPIIAVTAITFSGEQENCFQYGITKVLNKPVDKAMLDEALAPYRSQEEQTYIDQKTIQTLIGDLGREKVLNLLNLYRNEASNLVSQIKNSSDTDRTRYAHTLAGMSENLGILMVGKTARHILGASHNTPETLPSLLDDLERHFASSLIEINGIIHSNRPVA